MILLLIPLKDSKKPQSKKNNSQNKNTVSKTRSQRWTIDSKTSTLATTSIAPRNPMSTLNKVRVWRTKILEAQASTSPSSLTRTNMHQFKLPKWALSAVQSTKQLSTLQLSNQRHSSHLIKSRASCQLTRHRIRLENHQLKSRPRKIRPRRRQRLCLLSQKEDGSAPNARITTLRAETFATDARKKKMMRIMLVSQNICLRLSLPRNKRNKPRLREKQQTPQNQLTNNPSWSSPTNGPTTPTTELQRRRNSKNIRWINHLRMEEMATGLVKGAWTITSLSEKHATFATWASLRATESFSKSKPRIKWSMFSSIGANSRCQCHNTTIIWIWIVNMLDKTKFLSNNINNIDDLKECMVFSKRIQSDSPLYQLKTQVCKSTYFCKKLITINKTLFHFLYIHFRTILNFKRILNLHFLSKSWLKLK